MKKYRRRTHLNDSVTAGTYRWTSILEASTHLWLRMKLEALDCGPEDWTCMAPHSLLAATSPLPAELTQPAPLLSPLLPYQPSSSSALLSRGLASPIASSLSLGSQGNFSGFSSSLPNSFLHRPKQSASHPVPPLASRLPPPLLSSPQSLRIRVIPPLFIRAISASQPTSERGSHPDSQFFPWQQHQPANTHAVQSWLFAAVATAGVSRQQAPAPAQPALALSGLRSRGCWGAVREPLGGKSPRWYHAARHPAQLRRVQVGVGGGSFSSIALCDFSFSRLAPSATSISYLLSLTWSLPLSSARGSLPSPSQLLALLLSVCLSTRSHSLYFQLAIHPPNSSLSLSPK